MIIQDANRDIREKTISRCVKYCDGLMHRNGLTVGNTMIVFAMDESIKAMQGDAQFIEKLLTRIEDLEGTLGKLQKKS